MSGVLDDPPAPRPPSAAGREHRRRTRSWTGSRAVLRIGLVDVAAPLLTYQIARASGAGEVTALLLAGIPAAAGVVVSAVRRASLDVIGALIVGGLVLSAAIGVFTGDPRLILLKGAVGTAAFGAVCLGSLFASRPLLYGLALGFLGRDTPRGRDYTDRWQYPGFRRYNYVITAVWGAAYLAEAAVKVGVILTQGPDTALVVTKVLPYAVLAILVPWMLLYGLAAQRRGRRVAARTAGAAPRDTPSPTTGTGHATTR